MLCKTITQNTRICFYTLTQPTTHMLTINVPHVLSVDGEYVSLNFDDAKPSPSSRTEAYGKATSELGPTLPEATSIFVSAELI